MQNPPHQEPVHVPMKNLKIVLLLGVAVLTQVMPVHAQTPVSTVRNLEAEGYALMDNINTPLLHPVMTGVRYDLRALAHRDPFEPAPGPSSDMRTKAASRDEFERQEVAVRWSNFIAERIEALKRSNAYLIPLRTNWKEYSFVTHRFAAEFTMYKSGWRTKSTAHCAGSYLEVVEHSYLTACLTGVNLNSGDPRFQYFTLPDVALARRVKTNPTDFRVYAMAEPAGTYQILRGAEMRYIPTDTYTASGVQPVKVTNLALVDISNGEILAFAYPHTPPPSLGVSREMNAASGSTPSPRWLKYSQHKDGTFYVDMSSLRRKDDIVTVTELTDYKEIEQRKIASTIGVYAYNCLKRTFKRMSLQAYSEHMGRGSVNVQSTDIEDMGSIDVGSVSEAVLNLVCNATPASK